MTRVRTDDDSRRLQYRFLGSPDSPVRLEWTFGQWGAAVIAVLVVPPLLWSMLSPWPLLGATIAGLAGIGAGLGAGRLVGLATDPETPLPYYVRVLITEVTTPRPDAGRQEGSHALTRASLARPRGGNHAHAHPPALPRGSR